MSSERPILKLKMPKTAGAAGPTAPPSGTKLKLSFSGLKKASKSANEMAEKPASSPKVIFKQGKKKPAVLKGKKREHEDEQAPDGIAGPKRLKLTSKGAMSAKTPTTPFMFKLKAKGQLPTRPQGIGYDSEASDTEQDPHIEEEYILRMQPGEDCDYVRDAIANKKMGLSRAEGGADVKLKFLRKDGRRAVLIVRGNMYAASMVDLPCIVEGMKSWDKKGWWKTADICQMLLVLGPVKSEEEANNIPLPKNEVRNGTFMYEHGLTPPMKWVRKRRFRKRVSTNIVVQVEQAVEQLFKRDAEAASSSWKLQTLEELNEERAREQMELEDAEGYGFPDDAEGEYEEEPDAFQGEVFDEEGEDAGEADAGWEDLLEEAFDEEVAADSEAPTPAAHVEAVPTAATTNTSSEAATPTAITAVIDAEDEAETPAGQDDADEESGSDADEDDLDEEADEGQIETQRQRDEIVELENVLNSKKDAMAKVTNPLLRRKQVAIIKDLEQSIALKKAAIGEGDEED